MGIYFRILKIFFAAAFLIVLIITLARKRQRNAAADKSRPQWATIAGAVIFSTLSALYFTGTVGRPHGVANLSLPFKKGTYFVFQGGYGLPANVFHYGLRGAVYAMDIVKLNKAGGRAAHVFSARLQDYESFADTIYSPCSGIVRHTASNNPDNIPPSRKRGPTNTNHVLLETSTMYVFMGHLGYHQVFVAEGDTVTAGAPLGLVGNSGFSIEPHLHLQAHARTGSGLPWYKEPPLQIAFGGKSYLLFEEIIAGK